MPQVMLKTPKGTRDCAGQDMVLRKKIFQTITSVFEQQGAEELDTPVFELKDILSEKYGEDSKLIYDLQDQGGEKCSLRYDLTVPFARYLAMNNVQDMKRYQLGKVYRRDAPAMTKGRMREFFQCDLDIAGTYGPMIPDAEILGMAADVLDRLGWKGTYTIKINHRKILDGIFAVCGVPADKTRTISSAVDKLDKLPWTEVRREMVEEKGLQSEVADRIGEYVQLKGGEQLLETLKADTTLSSNETAKEGLQDIDLLFNFLDDDGLLDRVSLDMSLARGLDYYTGVIYEIITEGSAPASTEGQILQRAAKKAKAKDFDEDRSSDPTIGVGSVAAGGRYDKLVGMFSNGKDIPCVGISFGVERIFSITKTRLQAQSNTAALRASDTDVYVMAFGGKGFNGMLRERRAVCRTLRQAGIKTDYLMKEKPKLQAQFKEAEKGGVPFAVILGEDELREGKVKVKEMGLPSDHPEKDGLLVEKKALVEEIKSRLDKTRMVPLMENLGLD